MSKPVTYEHIKNYINSEETGNGCNLLLDEEGFKNAKIEQGKSNTRIKLKILCKCGKEFSPTYATFSLKISPKKQCTKCGILRTILKSETKYKEIFEYINNKSINNNCKLLTTEEEFNDEKIKQNKSSTYVKLKMLCSCGNEFWKDFNNFKAGQKRCNICAVENMKLKQKTTHQDFCKKVFEKHEDEYIVLGKYINAKTKILIRHNSEKCNYYEWGIIPDNFLGKNVKCPKCSHPSSKKTNEEFKQEVFSLLGDEYTVLGDYIGKDDNIEIFHKTCNRSFSMSPHNFLSGQRCTICNESTGERRIRKYLENKNISFLPQKDFSNLKGVGGNPLKFDFAIFNDILKTDLNFLLEYDGEFHYILIKYKNETRKVAEKRFEKQKYHDKRKNEYCKNNNIKLIRIPYWEFDNIEEILDKELFNLDKFIGKGALNYGTKYCHLESPVLPNSQSYL